MNSTSSKGYSTISEHQKGYEIPRKQVPPLPTALSGKAWGRAAKKAGWVALATAAVVMAALSLDSGRTNVSFLARHLNDTTPGQTRREALVFPDVVHNAGGGYDPTTGLFTAPTAGTYVVLAGLLEWGQPDGDMTFNVHLVQDGEYQLEVPTQADRDVYWDASSVQAVLRLGKGQQLWLEAYGSKNPFYRNCRGCNWFSAALLAADP